MHAACTLHALYQVSSWSDLVNSFAESCALCNQMLLCKQMQPAAGPLEEEGLRLLPVAELAPVASGGAYDIDAGDLALEPRSVEWQRWARMWNTIVRSLRARDLLSNAERDELLFFSLREIEHVAFFGCPEYLVFPAMLASPLFYAKLWHRRLLGLYPHTLRSALQTRDLAVFLLVTLDVVPASQKATMCAVVNRMWAHAARVVDLRASDGLAKVSRPQAAPLPPCTSCACACTCLSTSHPPSLPTPDPPQPTPHHRAASLGVQVAHGGGRPRSLPARVEPRRGRCL